MGFLVEILNFKLRLIDLKLKVLNFEFSEDQKKHLRGSYVIRLKVRLHFYLNFRSGISHEDLKFQIKLNRTKTETQSEFSGV